MQNKLQQYFPMIRTREEIKREIEVSSTLKNIFRSWREEQQEEFLDFCSGARGIKMLYDAFFKEIFNPEIVPERLNRLLTLLLGREVKIVSVLPNDSARIADEGSLLITDVVVELEDGSLANLEIQKIGYRFPGARSACYSADLLLRQYKRIRGEKKKKFNYRDIKSVYTIVLFEKSTSEFHRFQEEYIHKFRQRSDTGMELELLQKYLFIPLDIFRKSLQNKGIRSELDAWLAFLCVDEPEVIIKLITEYPQFRPMYEHIYNICQNVEDVMGIFSKELQEMDRNTVQYMIDEMQEEIDKKKAQLEQKKAQLEQKKAQLEQKKAQLEQKKAQLEEKKAQLEEKKAQLEQKDAQLEEKNAQLEQKDAQLEEKNAQLEQKDAQLEQSKTQVEQQKEEICRLREKINALEKNRNPD